MRPREPFGEGRGLERGEGWTSGEGYFRGIRGTFGVSAKSHPREPRSPLLRCEGAAPADLIMNYRRSKRQCPRTQSFPNVRCLSSKKERHILLPGQEVLFPTPDHGLAKYTCPIHASRRAIPASRRGPLEERLPQNCKTLRVHFPSGLQPEEIGAAGQR